MIKSIEGAVRREIRAHRRKNSDLIALASRRGYKLRRLFTGRNWLILPGGFFLVAALSILSSIYLPLCLGESQASTIKDVASYILSAQVTLIALAIPVIIAGAQLLLSGRSAKGRELDLSILLELGRPREIIASSLLLITILLVLFSWPNEVVAGAAQRGARPYILAAAAIWFLANLAGYAVFIGTAIDLVSNKGRVRLRKTAIAWVGFEEEIGREIRSRLWYEFREELEAGHLAWTVQRLPRGEQWFGFASAGPIDDVRTTIFRIALRWLRFRNSTDSMGLGIAFYLGCCCKPGQYFSVYRRPDLIGRILLRLSLKLARSAPPTPPRFQPRELLEALGSDIEHQILTGTPADADAACEELFEMLHGLLQASVTVDGNYATETPLMSPLQVWVRPVHSASWTAANALQRSPEFAANLAERLAESCLRSAQDGLSPAIVRAFAEAVGLLLYVVSRRLQEDGRIGSNAHQEFVRRGQKALGRSLEAIHQIPETGESWPNFQRSAEMRLLLLDQIATNVSYIAWTKDLVSLKRYSAVLVDFAKDIGPSQTKINWHRVPDDLWQKDWEEVGALICVFDSMDSAKISWRQQALLDRLLLLQLVWAQWLAEGVRTDDEWVAFLKRLGHAVQGKHPSIVRYFFSFGPLLRRFTAICEAAGHDQLTPLNEFANIIDKVRDSDKEGGFYYSDAVYWVDQLTPAIAIHALISYEPQEMQGAEREIKHAIDHGMVNAEQAQNLLWKLHRDICNFPNGITQKLSPHISDWDERLTALQASIRACAELFGEDPGPRSR